MVLQFEYHGKLIPILSVLSGSISCILQKYRGILQNNGTVEGGVARGAGGGGGGLASDHKHAFENFEYISALVNKGFFHLNSDPSTS